MKMKKSVMFNQYPQTKYSHYTSREIVLLFDSHKEDADYLVELKNRFKRLLKL